MSSDVGDSLVPQLPNQYLLWLQITRRKQQLLKTGEERDKPDAPILFFY